jgi:hypothetical protein
MNEHAERFYRFFEPYFDSIPLDDREQVLTFIVQDLLQILLDCIDDKDTWLEYLKVEMAKLGVFVDKL